MIDPVNYNNNALKDMFLGNLYRIVSTFSYFNVTQGEIQAILLCQSLTVIEILTCIELFFV